MQYKCFIPGVSAVLESFSRPISVNLVVLETIKTSIVVSGYDITVYSSRLFQLGSLPI